MALQGTRHHTAPGRSHEGERRPESRRDTDTIFIGNMSGQRRDVCWEIFINNVSTGRRRETPGPWVTVSLRPDAGPHSFITLGGRRCDTKIWALC